MSIYAAYRKSWFYILDQGNLASLANYSVIVYMNIYYRG